MYYASTILNNLNNGWATIATRCNARYYSAGFAFDEVCQTMVDDSYYLFCEIVDLEMIFPHLTPVQQISAYRKCFRSYVMESFPYDVPMEDIISDFLNWLLEVV